MRILSRKIGYECPILRVEEREVVLDDGHRETRWVVLRQPNVSVVALTQEKEIVLIKERVGKNQEEVIALPSGKMKEFDPSPEALLAEARIELETEAGYRAGTMELLSSRETPSNYLERTYYRYVAWDLTPVGQSLEGGELITPLLVPAAQIDAFLQSTPLEYKSEVQAVKEAITFFIKHRLI